MDFVAFFIHSLIHALFHSFIHFLVIHTIQQIKFLPGVVKGIKRARKKKQNLRKYQ